MLASTAIALLLLPSVAPHGLLQSPASRNLIARSLGQEWTPHELNGGGRANAQQHGIGVCGENVLTEQTYTRPTYELLREPTVVEVENGVMNVEVEITAHHNGFFAMEICQKSAFDISPSSAATNECFSANTLARSNTQSPAMTPSPVDPSNPTRYYLPPLCALSRNAFDASTDHYLSGYKIATSFVFPDDIDCSSPGDCVMRWKWTTGNSCVPSGIAQSLEEHFGITRSSDPADWIKFNEAVKLPSSCPIDTVWTNLNMNECGDGGFPEEFVNCADIVTGNPTSDPVIDPPVIDPPVIDPPVVVPDQTPMPSMTPMPMPPPPTGCLSNDNFCVPFVNVASVFWDCHEGPDAFQCVFCAPPSTETPPKIPTTTSPTPTPTPPTPVAPAPAPAPPTPITPPSSSDEIVSSIVSSIVSYYSWNWGQGSDGPPTATSGISFTGLVNVPDAIRLYDGQGSWCCPKINGRRYISIGGGNSLGLFTPESIDDIANHLDLVISTGYAGIVYDVEHVQGSADDLIAAFSASFAAVKAVGLDVWVTTSHSAPYKALSSSGAQETPATSTALLTSWVGDDNIDVLSPQLYSSGTETEPEFAETNFCKEAGCTWELYQGAVAKIVPSIVDGSHYGASEAWFMDNYNIELGGWIQWKQQQAGEAPVMTTPTPPTPTPPTPTPPTPTPPTPTPPTPTPPFVDVEVDPTCHPRCKTCTHWANQCSTCCSKWNHCGATEQHCSADSGGVDCSGCKYSNLRA